MNGLCAVVTGAGSGIGRAVTKRLAGMGYQVVAIGRREEALSETRQSLGDLSGRVRTISSDVSDPKAIGKSLSEVGPVHAVVANAAVCLQARLDSPDSDQVWKEVLSTNLDGVYYTLKMLLPTMPREGRAVVVSSGLGKLGRAGYGAYTASKHAVLGLVKCLAKEVAPRRITVNAVCPGWVETEMAGRDLVRTADQSGKTVSEEKAEALLSIPLERFVTAEEVAGLICWLLSKDAAAVTGQAYNISCGEFFA